MVPRVLGGVLGSLGAGGPVIGSWVGGMLGSQGPGGIVMGSWGHVGIPRSRGSVMSEVLEVLCQGPWGLGGLFQGPGDGDGIPRSAGGGAVMGSWRCWGGHARVPGPRVSVMGSCGAVRGCWGAGAGIPGSRRSVMGSWPVLGSQEGEGTVMGSLGPWGNMLESQTAGGAMTGVP